MSAALQEPDDDEIKNALTDAGLSKPPTYAAMRRVLSNFVRLRKIREPAAQSPSQPLVEVQEPEQQAVILLRRAIRQIERWSEKYGQWQPEWLPPAGDVRLLEDIDAYLQLPPGALAAPVRGLPLTEDIPLKVNQLIGHARRLHGFANRLETTNAFLSKEVRTVAYDMEKIAQDIYDSLAAHGIGTTAPGGNEEAGNG